MNNLVKIGEKYMKKKLKVLGISVLSLILVLIIGIGMIFKGEIRTLISLNKLMNIHFMKWLIMQI